MAITLEGKEYLTCGEAAESLGTTPTKVLMLLKKGDLKGEELLGIWYVEPDSLACCKAHGIDMKVELGCASYCSSGGCGCK